MINQRHLRNYLLDRDYQLKHALLLVGLVLALTLGLGCAVTYYMNLAARVVEVRALDPQDTLAPILAMQMQRSNQRVLLIFGAFELLLLTSLFAYGIVFTHRVAGPLYKISTYMSHIRDGRLGQVYDLRKGDQLRPFFESFREMHAALQKRTGDEAERLERIRELLALGRAEEAGAALAALHEEKLAQLS